MAPVLSESVLVQSLRGGLENELRSMRFVSGTRSTSLETSALLFANLIFEGALRRGTRHYQTIVKLRKGSPLFCQGAPDSRLGWGSDRSGSILVIECTPFEDRPGPYIYSFCCKSWTTRRRYGENSYHTKAIYCETIVDHPSAPAFNGPGPFRSDTA